MFEKYTERACRVMFFARYEASQSGSKLIKSEHLLLGLFRESKTLFFGVQPLNGIRDELTKFAEMGEKISTSIDLPLSDEVKRIFFNAQEEAKQLKHGRVGHEHMLLGIFREERCLAAEVLRTCGMDISTVRVHVSTKYLEQSELDTEVTEKASSRAELLDRISALVEKAKREITSQE